MTSESPFRPPVALASLSGQSDAAWASAVDEYVGAALLGGIALDDPTRQAASLMTARDREEFLPPDPFVFVDLQLAAVADRPLLAGFNVRASSPEPVAEAARICAGHDAVLEVNAHCRQEEMCAVGAGETLLKEPDRLCAQVRAASETGTTVSVKIRTEVGGVDIPAVAARASEAGADWIHVDAMDSEPTIAEVAATIEGTDAQLVANNGIRDRETVHEYLEYGADAVSVGRPSDDPDVLDRVRRATTEYFGAQAGGPL